MKPGRPRIWVIASVFAGVACVLVVHLYLLMVEQGPAWLERSYRNRWGFKDVPTRRGSILDREGSVLAEDEPAFALFLHYRAFRREHPVGCVVHGANLAMRAGGYGDDLFGFDQRARGPREALDSLLAVPGSWLRGMGVVSEVARDLRFYAGALVVQTTGRRWSEVKPLLVSERAPANASLADLLGAEVVASVRREFERRLLELEGLVAAIAASGQSRSLWNALEEHRVERYGAEDSEHIERRIYKRVPFELAARVRMLADRQPGFTARPAVARRHHTVPGRADLASLRPLLGRVRQYWREDFDDTDAEGRAKPTRVDQLLPRALLEDLVPPSPDLPAELAARLQARARRSVEAYLLTQGRVGAWGLESYLDARLAGRPGLRLIERDRTAREQAQWSSLETEPGEDARLTLDLRLQAHLERSLDRHPDDGEVAMAIIDPKTGDVLALGGRPLPPPAEPAYSTPATMCSGVGFVGSVAKPFVALEQLDAERRGRATRNHREFEPCSGRFRAHGLRCEGHLDVASDVSASLARSCNFFFYQAAEALGAEGVLRAYERVGWVGEDGDERRYQRTVPGIARAAQGASLVEKGGWLEQKAIGYHVRVNTLQVARAYAALATGALPRLSLVDPDRPHKAVPLGVHAADLELVRDGLQGCVSTGTAKRVTGLRAHGVLAKTGTAEISTKTHHNNAWLAGYLTRRNPTLAFAAVAYDVPDGDHGAEVAGALVSDFLEAVYADPELRQRYMPEASGR